MPNSILRIPSLCSFISLSIVWVQMPLTNRSGSSRDLTFFITSFVSLFDIICVVDPNPKNFYESQHSLLWLLLLMLMVSTYSGQQSQYALHLPDSSVPLMSDDNVRVTSVAFFC